MSRRMYVRFLIVVGIFSAQVAFADSSVGIDIFTNGFFTADGDVDMDDADVDTIVIGQNGLTPDVVSIAGDLSIEDVEWEVTSGGAATFATLTLEGNIFFDNNSILTDATTIASTELDLLDGHEVALVDIDDAVSTAITGVGTLSSLTVSGAVAANGGITFDAATDTLGAHTLAGTLDADTNIITNIGNAGTDFTASGGLTLANSLTIGSGTAITQHLSGTATNLTSASIGAGSCGDYGIITVTGASAGDTVVATPDPTSSASGIEDVNLVWNAAVTASNTVIIRACNPQTLGSVNAGDDQEWRADVWKH